MNKSAWSFVLKVIIAVASVVAGVFGSQTLM
nr:smalltalk protein [uncultured Bacteroides sp.]